MDSGLMGPACLCTHKRACLFLLIFFTGNPSQLVPITFLAVEPISSNQPTCAYMSPKSGVVPFEAEHDFKL